MNPYVFHISFYDVLFTGAIFIGLNFAVLLAFVKSVNHTANRFLALALITMILWMMRILAIDVNLQSYLPRWDWLPMQFLLALGPLIYFYVLKITQPEYKLRRKDLLHFSPLLLEQAALVLEMRESGRTGAATYTTLAFQQLNLVLQLLIFISLIIYLYKSHRLIENFYRRLQPVLMDRSRLEFRWLRRLMAATALLWVLWIVYAAVEYWGYRNQSGVHGYYLFYIFFAVIIIWTAVAAFLKPQAALLIQTVPAIKPPPSSELKQKAHWLKMMVKENRYYQDPELSLNSLAEKLDLTPHELSRIINTVLKKSFNDFINEYRIQAVIQKMQDPACDHITLLGIAFESGFNAQSSFSRIFKQLTGKAPLAYKNELKKDFSFYNLRSNSQVAPIISYRQTTHKWAEQKLNRNYMFKNYLKIAWRSLLRNKTQSFINIAGLSVGMAVAMLIGLWIWDEASYDKYHLNYDSIGQVMTTQTSNSQTITFGVTVAPLGNELRSKYGNYFKLTALTSGGTHVLAAGETKISQQGLWAEPDLPAMLSLVMVKGHYGAFKDPTSMLLSAATANALFGNGDPINKTVRIDNSKDMKVIGVYLDLPDNTTLSDTKYLLPWANPANFWNTQQTRWDNHGVQLYVQLNPNVNFDKVSAQVKNITTPYNKNINETIQIFPMARWHLYSNFQNGKSVGGRIQFIWLFGIIGSFVLLLACINFMNLSTARSEKRAREVGIRKAIGSLRSQLIAQFLSESMLVVFLALILTIVLVWLAIPYFNEIAVKQVALPLGNPVFWLFTLGFTCFTGLMAGSYPAFYLSAFKPIKVLKGVFKVGRLAALPRKVLVVVQFTVSIVLIIGTITVFRQIQYASNRPVGYTREGLITVEMNTPEIRGHYEPMRNDLIASGAALNMAESSNATTELSITNTGFDWAGKPPGFDPSLGQVFVSPDFGKTIGWKLIDGRDFSRAIPADTGAFILNESAVKLVGIKNPIGQTMHWFGKNHVITGIVKDIVMESPYAQTRATVFQMKPDWVNRITVRINPKLPMQEALSKIAPVFKKYNPGSPFEYKFNDDEYAKKFSDEQKVGRLARVFAVLAVFISCLGLFGMASFVAEQRTKEIGIRKVLGATVFNLWQLLSKDFVALVIISMLVAAPVAYYFMHKWLQAYDYRVGISWWVFIVTALAALLITLATVSYQSIKAALLNPVRSLRSE